MAEPYNNSNCERVDTGSKTVSIILTTYHRNDSLRRAINAIRAQTYENIELIVVDDSGVRHAEQVVEEYDDIIYAPHQQNKGHIEAWHTGFRKAEGQYVQLHDDDDWLEPKKIAEQVNLLETKSDVGVVHCGLRAEGGSIHIPDSNCRGNVVEQALDQRVHLCQTTSMLIQSDLLEQIFPLQSYGAGDDIHLAIELATRTKFDFTEEPLVNRGDSEGSKGKSVSAWRARLAIINDYLHLFKQLDENKQRKILAHIHLRIGIKYMVNSFWSPKAIRSMIKANYYNRELNYDYIRYSLGALLGKPGQIVYSKLSD